MASISKLEERLGGTRLKEAVTAIRTEIFIMPLSIVLQYYDKAYDFAINRRMGLKIINYPGLQQTSNGMRRGNHQNSQKIYCQMKTIYLDYNATTPLDPEVASEMRPFMEDFFGNPSSTHDYGVRARQGVELARKRLSSLLNCYPDEIIFTSGGTESNNMAIKGVALFNAGKGKPYHHFSR